MQAALVTTQKRLRQNTNRAVKYEKARHRWVYEARLTRFHDWNHDGNGSEHLWQVGH